MNYYNCDRTVLVTFCYSKLAFLGLGISHPNFRENIDAELEKFHGEPITDEEIEKLHEFNNVCWVVLKEQGYNRNEHRNNLHGLATAFGGKVKGDKIILD